MADDMTREEFINMKGAELAEEYRDVPTKELIRRAAEDHSI